MTNEKKPTYKQIWDTLSKINVKEHVEKRDKFDYVSWANAWWLLMEEYPEATYQYHEGRKFDDGTVEVSVTIMIGETSRTTTLPVMDYRNKAIVSPDSRQVNDAKQRCFVKAMAMYGLGISVYRGLADDLPSEEKDRLSKEKPLFDHKIAPAHDVTTKVAPRGKWAKVAEKYLNDFQMIDLKNDFEQFKDIAQEKLDSKEFEGLKEFVEINKLRQQNPYKACLAEGGKIYLALQKGADDEYRTAKFGP
jgi:hypothetical protein